MKKLKQYIFTVGDALSQLINATIFFSSNANESLSGRCWRERDHWFYGRLRYVIDFIFTVFGGPLNHCYEAHQADVTRASATLRSARL